MNEEKLDAEQMSMNIDDLYREDIYTDRKVGTIRVLTPVTADGSEDGSRDPKYVGQAQMYTPAGALPLSFEIDANNLGEAADKFADEARQAMERAIDELNEMRRQSSSQIVVPGAGGSVPGGGIQMP